MQREPSSKTGQSPHKEAAACCDAAAVELESIWYNYTARPALFLSLQTNPEWLAAAHTTAEWCCRPVHPTAGQGGNAPRGENGWVLGVGTTGEARAHGHAGEGGRGGTVNPEIGTPPDTQAGVEQPGPTQPPPSDGGRCSPPGNASTAIRGRVPRRPKKKNKALVAPDPRCRCW